MIIYILKPLSINRLIMGNKPCKRFSLCRVPITVNNTSLFPGLSVCHKDVSSVCVFFRRFWFPRDYRSYLSNSFMRVYQKTVLIKVGSSYL